MKRSFSRRVGLIWSEPDKRNTGRLCNYLTSHRTSLLVLNVLQFILETLLSVSRCRALLAECPVSIVFTLELFVAVAVYG